MARLRIIGGELGGRMIRAPAGAGTRPTADRVREALYSIVLSALGDLSNIRVLDLFAGSGALALEALSRGAAEAVLVDRDRGCQRTIRENVAALGLGEMCRVLPMTVARALDLLEEEGRGYELVLADPPYADDPAPLLQRLGQGSLVVPAGMVVVEHASRTNPAAARRDAKGRNSMETVGHLSLELTRQYGDSALSVYRSRAQREGAKPRREQERSDK
jgi:16S rRNA (guanine966-N2)-methyltransferase